ncbi:hypothetical protein CQA66_00060 [Helicobacter aurati]|uniref:Uncharacterized protein n=1 Tax=Helicobacter aurati TaxID=137778 RepID=A0A3D8J7Z2_9HELI|nr:hypothetical protein [Helicobacter aurati]RDU73629.1 hypothetical protein CQA66_00060 [Helicobacter aurati]
MQKIIHILRGIAHYYSLTFVIFPTRPKHYLLLSQSSKKITQACVIFCYIALCYMGCATHYPDYSKKEALPFTHKTFTLEVRENKNIQTQILHIFHQDKTYIFALFDLLGTPLALKEFKQGKFINKKFLPPKQYYNILFLSILTLIEKQKKEEIISLKNITIKVQEIENLHE